MSISPTLRLRRTTACIGVIATAALLACTLPASADLASSFGVYVYPESNQSAYQQNEAESACYASAQSRTGFNPAAPPPPSAPAPTQQHGFLRGGAGGAAAGTLIGAIAGNAGEGAAIGAVAGGLFGFHRQKEENQQAQQNAQASSNAQYEQGMNNFRSAFSACMNSKGYVAR
jgi:predicted lipid-binding transport protein (Tim44 family)